MLVVIGLTSSLWRLVLTTSCRLEMIMSKMFMSAQFWGCKAVTSNLWIVSKIINSKTLSGVILNLPQRRCALSTNASKHSSTTTTITTLWSWMGRNAAAFKKSFRVLAHLFSVPVDVLMLLSSCQRSSVIWVGSSALNSASSSWPCCPHNTQERTYGTLYFKRWRRLQAQNSVFQLISRCYSCSKTVWVHLTFTIRSWVSILRLWQTRSKFPTTVKMRWSRSTPFWSLVTIKCAKHMPKSWLWLLTILEFNKFKITTQNFLLKKWYNTWIKQYPNSKYMATTVLKAKYYSKFTKQLIKLTSSSHRRWPM